MLKIDQKTATELYPTATGKFKTMLEEKFGEILIPKKITDKVKSFEDACKILGKDPKKELPYAKPANARQEFANAAIMLDIISEALSEGVILDWANLSQKKWWPLFTDYKSGSGFRFDGSGGVWASSGAGGGARLCVPTKELANYFGNQFLSIWNKFLNPNK